MKQHHSRKLCSMLTSYGLTGTLSLVFDVVMTKVRFAQCRLIRRPHFIRGRRWIVFGNNFSCGRGLRLEALGNSITKSPLIRIGTDVALNDYVHIGAVESVFIGDRVLIASKVFITDHDHGCYGKDEVHSDPRIPPRERLLYSAPVVIEEDVWLGESVSVLAGVRIGKGAIIGTLSTVTRDIPPYSIAVGSPARVIKKFNVDKGKWERI